MTFMQIAVTVRCDQCGTEQNFNCDPDMFYGSSDFLAAAGWGYIEAGRYCLDICPACMEADGAEQGEAMTGFFDPLGRVWAK